MLSAAQELGLLIKTLELADDRDALSSVWEWAPRRTFEYINQFLKDAEKYVPFEWVGNDSLHIRNFPLNGELTCISIYPNFAEHGWVAQRDQLAKILGKWHLYLNEFPIPQLDYPDPQNFERNQWICDNFEGKRFEKEFLPLFKKACKESRWKIISSRQGVKKARDNHLEYLNQKQ